MKKTLIILIYFSFVCCFSQEKSKVDILKNKLIEQSDTTYINSLLEITSIYLSEKKIDSSEKYVKKALLKVKTKQLRAKVLFSLGTVNYLKEDFATANINYSEALQIFKSLSDTIKIIKTSERMAVIQYKNSNFDKANKIFINELQLAEKVNYIEAQATSSNNIASIYSKQKRYKKSLEYYLKSLKIYQKSNNKAGIAATYNNMGDVYKNLNKYDDAFKYYSKSLDGFKEIKFEQGIAYCKVNIGKIHFLKKKYNQAIQFSEDAEKILSKINDNYGLADVYTNLGDIYYEKNNDTKSDFYFNKSIKHAKIISSEDYIQKNYKKLSSQYLRRNDYKKAYNYFQKYTVLKDSIFNNEKAKTINQLNIKYETEKKNQEIELLNSKREFQNKILYVLSIGLLTLLSFFIVILIQKNKKNQAYKELVQKNLELIKSEKHLSLDLLKTRKNFNKNNKSSTKIVTEEQKELLPDDQKEVLIKGLLNLIENEKICLDKELTINKIAKKLKTNKLYISHIINTEFSQNFNTYINSCRIKEAIVLLTDTEFDNYSLEGIGNHVGFKSKSTFNIAFKNTTGVTPSFFKNQVKEIKDNNV